MTSHASTGNHVPIKGAREEEDDSDTIHVQQPSPKKLAHIRTTSQISTAASNNTASSTSGMAGLSLTSPSVSGLTQQEALTTPKRRRTPPVQHRTVYSVLRHPATKAEEKGSAHNPIVLEEYFPRRHLRPPHKPHKSEEGPHKFYKASRKQYANHLIRPPLASKPTNGSTFTGDKGNDMYRMRSAKFAAGEYGPQAPPSVIGFGVPFEVQYPRLAQHVAQQSSPLLIAQQSAPATQQTHHQVKPQVQYWPPPSIPMPPPAPSEDTLRRKALQHIRDHSRPQQHKKLLSNDPDETSASEPESISRASSATSKRRKMTVYQDPNDHLTPLVAQSQILTSLLQKYPRSKDKKGVREDIAMLVSVQNERLETWMQHEAKGKKRGGGKDGVGSVGKGKGEAVREEMRKDKDGEVSDLLSAGAGMWQDGSGEGVADVYQAA